MTFYETEDGEPRYGKRLPPEELAAYLRRHGAVEAAPRRSRGLEAAGGKAPRRAHRWRTLGVGLVLMLVVPPLLLVAGVLVLVDGSPTRGAQLGEDGVAYLREGATAGLYGTSATATADCVITGPDGVAVILDIPEEGVPYTAFTASQTGAYTVTCPAGTTGLVVGPPMKLERIPLAAAAVLGAGVVGIAGLVTTIIGAARARR